MEAAQAAFERLHHRILLAARPRKCLGRDKDSVALAAQRVAKRDLGFAAAVGLGSVEIINAQVECMPDQVLLAR